MTYNAVFRIIEQTSVQKEGATNPHSGFEDLVVLSEKYNQCKMRFTGVSRPTIINTRNKGIIILHRSWKQWTSNASGGQRHLIQSNFVWMKINLNCRKRQSAWEQRGHQRRRVGILELPGMLQDAKAKPCPFRFLLQHSMLNRLNGLV